MSNRFALSGLLAAPAIAAILIGLLQVPQVSAQSKSTDWEKAAGGKMSFDVASVKQSSPNVPWSAGRYPVDGTLYSANVPLMYYIAFAYKLRGAAATSLAAELPKWVTQKRFEIQARAASPSTEDQMRVMMQSLLAERFKLVVHWEKRKARSYNLVLVRPGRIGSQLQPHNDKVACKPYAPNSSGYDSIPGQLPAFCGRIVGGAGPGGISLAGRNVTMVQLADSMSGATFGDAAFVIVDKTGLKGSFDINLNYRFSLTPEELKEFGPGDIRTGYMEAFRDQLGIKLEPSTAFVDALVVDHIEEPSPN